MPEDGETFRPAKDILQELFLERATRPPVTGSTAASLDGAVGVGGEAETVNSSSVCGGQQPAQARNTGQQRLSAGEPEHQQAAAEESDEAPDHGGGNLPDKAQSWEPTWGLASSEGPPAAAISGPFPESGSKADPQQQVQGTAQSAWEAAWEGSLAPGVPDQAASSASAQPVLDAAWDPDWGSSHAIATSAPPQQEIMLLLPSREPPPPPAMTGAQSVAQHNRSAAQRECALPVMRPEDRQKCERFYKQVCASDLLRTVFATAGLLQTKGWRAQSVIAGRHAQACFKVPVKVQCLWYPSLPEAEGSQRQQIAGGLLHPNANLWGY